jgi:hypothetical protein
MQPTPVPWLKQAAAEVAPSPFPSQDGAFPAILHTMQPMH